MRCQEGLWVWLSLRVPLWVGCMHLQLQLLPNMGPVSYQAAPIWEREIPPGQVEKNNVSSDFRMVSMWGTSTPILMKAERAMYVMSTMIAGAKTSICFAGSPYPSVLVIHNFLLRSSTTSRVCSPCSMTGDYWATVALLQLQLQIP